MSSPCEAVNMGRHGLSGCPVIPGAWDSLEETRVRRASSDWPQFKGSGDPTLFYKEQGYRNLIKGTVGTWVSSLKNTGLVLCGLRLITQVWLPFLLVLLHSSSIRFFKFQEETVTVELVRAKFPVLGTPVDLTDRSSTVGKSSWSFTATIAHWMGPPLSRTGRLGQVARITVSCAALGVLFPASDSMGRQLHCLWCLHVPWTERNTLQLWQKWIQPTGRTLLNGLSWLNTSTFPRAPFTVILKSRCFPREYFRTWAGHKES